MTLENWLDCIWTDRKGVNYVAVLGRVFWAKNIMQMSEALAYVGWIREAEKFKEVADGVQVQNV